MMRLSRSLIALTATPMLQNAACRSSSAILHHDPRATCAANPFVFERAPQSYIGVRQSQSARRFTTTTKAASGYRYRIGASYSAKGKRFNPKKDLYSFIAPKADAEKSEDGRPLDLEYNTGRGTSGQDAFFVSQIGSTHNVAFGVADGVGGWVESGIDPAHFSHGLCQNMVDVAASSTDSEAEDLHATALLKEAYTRVEADDTVEGGGSTACIAIGRENGTMEVANLGDSGFAHFRLNKVHHFSDPQTHAFNTPFQLSIIPPRILARSRVFGGGPLQDMPEDAGVTRHEVQHGDVLVFATDGVWDNLDSNNLLRIIQEPMRSFRAWETKSDDIYVSDHIYDLTVPGGIPKEYENSLQTLLAVTIAGEAKAASLDTRTDGPFAREIQKYFPHEEYFGGKVDDICAIVAIVVKE